MIEWREGGGGGGGSKQKGQEKSAPLHLIPKMHVGNTSHQIIQFIRKKHQWNLEWMENLMITSQMISGWPCNGICNGGIY
jgi:hypothetical protein